MSEYSIKDGGVVFLNGILCANYIAFDLPESQIDFQVFYTTFNTWISGIRSNRMASEKCKI